MEEVAGESFLKVPDKLNPQIIERMSIGKVKSKLMK
jgi:hypothetical protein